MTKKIILSVIILLFLPISSFSGETLPLPRDTQGVAIQAVNAIKGIMNLSIGTSSYVAVTLPQEYACKSVYVKTRLGNSWRIATGSSPSYYMLVDFNLSLAVVSPPGTILFYARADTVEDTLEIVFMD